MMKQDTLQIAIKSFERYRNMALPYLFKDSKMEEGTNKEEMYKRMKEIHTRNKAIFEKIKKQRQLKEDEK